MIIVVELHQALHLHGKVVRSWDKGGIVGFSSDQLDWTAHKVLIVDTPEQNTKKALIF